MNNNKTGKFILSLRQEKGLSQYQLAEMIPISRQAVSKWERGENIPDSYTLLKLSEIFNVSINELLLGERQLDNSVESLEKTTLSILDESNKKSRKIKKLLITFTTIITVLLLAFLSYYFITSYNSIQVYTISGDDGKFNTNNGIFVTTNEKYYLKLGKIRTSEGIKINNIKLCYKENNKEVVMAEDLDADNLNIWDYYGYSEKINTQNIKSIMNNTYLKIKYNDDKEDVLKLYFKRDFINSSLFQKKNPDWEKNTNTTVKPKAKEVIVKEEDKSTEKVEEEKKEETKHEETKEQTAESPKQEVKPVVNEPKEETKTSEPEPVVEEITIEKIMNKIKEKGTYTDDGYIYEVNSNGNSIIYTYYENMNQAMMFNNTTGDTWSYLGTINMYSCATEFNEELCKNIIFENARQYLFK